MDEDQIRLGIIESDKSYYYYARQLMPNNFSFIVYNYVVPTHNIYDAVSCSVNYV